MKAVADAGFGPLSQLTMVRETPKLCKLADQQVEILKQLKILRLEYEQLESPISSTEISAMSCLPCHFV